MKVSKALLKALGSVALAGGLCVSSANAAITVSPVNHVTDTTIGGTRTIFFRTVGTSDCAAANQITFPPSEASIDPTSNSGELIFNISTSDTLTDITGTGAIAAGDVVIRVEVDGSPTTNIALFEHGNGYSPTTSPLGVDYGTTTGVTKTIGISLNGATTPAVANTEFCRAAVISACQESETDSVAPSVSLRFMVIGKSLNSSGTTLEDMSESIKVVLASCPATMDTTTGQLDVPNLDISLINGDEKVKFVNNTVPPTDDRGVPLTKAVVYGQQTSNAGAITTSAEVRREFQAEQGTFTIDGLTNEVSYCFSLGWVNAAGLVATSDGNWAATLPNGSCATPSKINGFLDRSTCFVASAAYGYEWDPRLETLRQFRDQILAQFGVGRDFIDWYYSWSPAAAQWLFKNPGYRLAIRAVLFPFVEGARALLWLRANMWALGVVLVMGTVALATAQVRGRRLNLNLKLKESEANAD